MTGQQLHTPLAVDNLQPYFRALSEAAFWSQTAAKTRSLRHFETSLAFSRIACEALRHALATEPTAVRYLQSLADRRAYETTARHSIDAIRQSQELLKRLGHRAHPANDAASAAPWDVAAMLDDPDLVDSPAL